MCPDLSPVEERALDQTLATALSWSALQPRLPFPFPIPPDTPPSPKPHYRSLYVYLGYQDLLVTDAWNQLSAFDLALRLIDFSPLRSLLAQRLYSPSPRGHVPFDPVSFFLLHSWRILNHWKRCPSLHNLAHPRYADYRTRFGFVEHVYPTEGGLRHFESCLGSASGNDLIAQTVELAHSIGCMSEEALAHGVITTDAMLHDAASRLRCKSVNADCYQPAPRSCRAKEDKHEGCACDTPACAQICRYATPRDRDARFVVYQGHNQTRGPNASTDPDRQETPHSKPRYGYLSDAARLLDSRRRTSWILADELLAANGCEDKAATELVEEVVKRIAWVHWEYGVGDAGMGREPFLSKAYELGLRRVVGLRAAEGDQDAEQQLIRGYDGKGIPLCPFGFRLHPNGWDYRKREMKWCCRRRCEHQKEREAPDCAHRRDGDKHGYVRNVGRTFPDNTTRLVRDVPYGSAAWKRIYGRARNAAEERNSELEALGLKRMPVYGWPRVRAMLITADMWINLRTMVRLIQEVVTRGNGPSPP